MKRGGRERESCDVYVGRVKGVEGWERGKGGGKVEKGGGEGGGVACLLVTRRRCREGTCEIYD